MNKVAIIHFSPIEKYPPILNLLDSITEKSPKTMYKVYTQKWYNGDIYNSNNKNIKIVRPTTNKKVNKVSSVISFFFFNVIVFFDLVFSRIKIILYYESISTLPAYWYSKICNYKLLIHYHEYTSPEEYKKNSKLVKWLHKKELYLYSFASWISHTNSERLNLFLTDEKILYNNKIHKIMPNYPSKKWAKSLEIPINNVTDNNPIKFVYIGSVGIHSMYIKEFAAFIIHQNGNATWDVYTNQFDTEAIDYLQNLNCKYINLKNSLNYYDIPKTIFREKYDVGLILYNGHIKNYVYNAPNKLFEYIACNLSVWYPNVMLGCNEYENTDCKPLVYKINFLESINFQHKEYERIKKKVPFCNTENRFFCEFVYSVLIDFIETN